MLIIGWIFIVIICGIIANDKNRSVAGWVILGICFGIFALIPLACLSKLDAKQ